MDIILTLVTFQGIITFLLLYSNERFKGDDAYLVIMIGAFVCHHLFKVSLYLFFDDAVYFNQLHGSFGLLYGPLAYFYFRKISQRGVSRKMVLAHISPFLFGLVFNVFLFTQALLGKLSLDLLHGYDLTSSVAIVVSQSVYSLFLLGQFSRAEDRVIRIKWGILFSLCLLMLMAFSMVIHGIVTQSSSFFGINTRMFYYLCQLAVLIYVIQARMRIYQIAPVASTIIPAPQTSPLMEEAPESPTQKYRNSTLSETDQDDILGRLKKLCEKEKPHLNPDITLEDISAKLDLPKHHLTQALNHRLGQNFYQYINRLRIHEAKMLIAKKEEENLATIGYESGFKSKSTFYKYFKEINGLNPSEYRKKIHEVALS